RDDTGHAALQVQHRVADEGGLTPSAGLAGAEVLEGHLSAAQHLGPERGPRRVPEAPARHARAQPLALAGRVQHCPPRAVDEVEILEPVHGDVALELRVIAAVYPLILAGIDGVGTVRVFLAEQVQVFHRLLGLAQSGHELESAYA